MSPGATRLVIWWNVRLSSHLATSNAPSARGVALANVAAYLLFIATASEVPQPLLRHSDIAQQGDGVEAGESLL